MHGRESTITMPALKPSAWLGSGIGLGLHWAAHAVSHCGMYSRQHVGGWPSRVCYPLRLPLHEVGQMLIDMAQESSDAINDLHQMNLEVHAKELNQRFAYSEARLDKIESRIEYMIEQFQLSKQ